MNKPSLTHHQYNMTTTLTTTITFQPVLKNSNHSTTARKTNKQGSLTHQWKSEVVTTSGRGNPEVASGEPSEQVRYLFADATHHTDCLSAELLFSMVCCVLLLVLVLVLFYYGLFVCCLLWFAY